MHRLRTQSLRSQPVLIFGRKMRKELGSENRRFPHKVIATAKISADGLFFAEVRGGEL